MSLGAFVSLPFGSFGSGALSFLHPRYVFVFVFVFSRRRKRATAIFLESDARMPFRRKIRSPLAAAAAAAVLYIYTSIESTVDKKTSETERDRERQRDRETKRYLPGVNLKTQTHPSASKRVRDLEWPWPPRRCVVDCSARLLLYPYRSYRRKLVLPVQDDESLALCAVIWNLRGPRDGERGGR